MQNSRVEVNQLAAQRMVLLANPGVAMIVVVVFAVLLLSVDGIGLVGAGKQAARGVNCAQSLNGARSLNGAQSWGSRKQRVWAQMTPYATCPLYDGHYYVDDVVMVVCP